MKYNDDTKYYICEVQRFLQQNPFYIDKGDSSIIPIRTMCVIVLSGVAIIFYVADDIPAFVQFVLISFSIIATLWLLFTRILITPLNDCFDFLNGKELQLTFYDKKLWDIVNQISDLKISSDKKRKLFLTKTKYNPIMKLHPNDIYLFKEQQYNLRKLQYVLDFNEYELNLIWQFLNKQYPDKETQLIERKLSYIDF